MSGDHVFISHARADTPFVAELRRMLETHSLPVWTDSGKLRGSSKLAPEVASAIETACQFIAVLSPSTVSSPWVKEEIEQALIVEARRRAEGYRVVPLLVGDLTVDALGLWFGKSPVAHPIQIGPGGLAEAWPAILTALGQPLPGESQPSETPAAPASPQRPSPPDAPSRRPLRLVLHGSEQDQKFVALLERHLTPLKRENVIEIWYAEMMRPGEPYQEAVQQAMEQADYILPLLSMDYLASEAQFTELMQVLRRREAGQVRVIPILLRPCDWEQGPLRGFKPLPRDGKPVIEWSDQDAALLSVTRDLASMFIADARQKQGRRPKLNPKSSTTTRLGDAIGALNDRVDKQKDALGFQAYVSAFARLIRDPGTQLPLTIGIFGFWGTGKSFLLKRLAEKLAEPASDGGVSRIHIIEFNAWGYSAAKAIWPSLARKVIDKLEESLPGSIFGWLWVRLRHVAGRLRALWRWLLVLLGLVLLGAVASFVLRSVPDQTGLFTQLSGHAARLWGTLTGTWKWAAGLLASTAALKWLVDLIARPLSERFVAPFHRGDYGKDIDYMEHIRQDIDFLSQRLDPEKDRILVIIDDLDRCEPQKAVEVLQAINLLLSFRQCVVCLGIDARILTKAIEDNYKNLLVEAGASGYEYLDKIIQIPFLIPTPGTEEIDTFLHSLLDRKPTPNSGTARNIAQRTTRERDEQPIQPTVAGGMTPIQQGAAEESAQPVEITPPGQKQSELPDDGSFFCEDEVRAFTVMKQYLRPNPRHMKRLVNVYTLVRTLAQGQNDQVLLRNPAATVRWLILCSQWPFMAHAMLYYFGELEQLRAADLLQAYPSEDPLLYLLERVTPQISQTKQRRLDYDVDILRMMLNETEGMISWEELPALRRYTVNFNPAIEAELQSEAVIKIEDVARS